MTHALLRSQYSIFISYLLNCLLATFIHKSSHFKVGACIALKDGTFVQGCNIENAAYGSTMCAERNAVFGSLC